MKQVIAIIKPFRLDNVRVALEKLGVVGMTISEVKGYGRQKGHTELYRGAEYKVDFIPKIKIEIVVPETQVESIINVIVESAQTEKIGDGKIFTLPVDQVVRIRTGERNGEAL